MVVEAVVSLPAMTMSKRMERMSLSVRSGCSTSTYIIHYSPSQAVRSQEGLNPWLSGTMIKLSNEHIPLTDQQSWRAPAERCWMNRFG